MNKRILVVDDVPDWRATLHEALNGDYQVETVDNYESAMDVIEQRDAELVIVDLRLSPTDENDRQGMDLLKQLARHRINAIVLTGYSDQALQDEAEEKYKAFDFIDKSTLGRNLQQLRDVVQEAFKLLERKEDEKGKEIKKFNQYQTVTFNSELSSWPIKNYRKKK
jgi:DNA-binding NtrC family response regulator